MRSDLLQLALTVKQRQAGYSLIEEGDHFLVLLKNNKPVAHFIAQTVTIQYIQQTADNDMEFSH